MFSFFKYDEPLFRPPAEAFSLILQATIGCSHNRCRFCGMYKSKRFRLRPLPELLQEIEAVPVRHRAKVRRIFLGDGDGLIYPQQDLALLLAALSEIFPNLTRVAAYASPASLQGKSVADLERLRTGKLRLLYFGLESGDDKTLESAGKGFTAEAMLAQCRKAQEAGMKLSVTAILGLAGRERSREHAAATAAWINALSPRYFSLLTLMRGGNDDYFNAIEPLANGEILEEALALVTGLAPQGTILRSDHVSNMLQLAGSYPKDRDRIIASAAEALAEGRRHPGWFCQVTDFYEKLY